MSGEKRRESLRTAAEDAEKSKVLATIDRSLEVDIDLTSLANESPDRSTMKELFRQLEFRALLKRVDELEEAVPGAAPRDLGAGRGAVPPGHAGDLGQLPHEVSLAVAGDGRAALGSALGEVLVVDARGDELASALRERKVLTHGLHLPGLDPAGDTQIAAYLIDPGRADYDVGDLAEESGVELTVQSDEETAALVQAAAAIPRLHADMLPKLEARELTRLYHDIELPLVPVLADMEAAGVKIDTYRLAEIAAKLRDQVDELEARAYELAEGPFTLGSPKQLGEVLFERLGLPVDRKGKTGYSTDARVLGKLRELHPIIEVVEQWREQSKLLNTYLEPLPGLVDPETAGCTPSSARPPPPPAGSPRSGRTSRTSRSGRRSGARSAARSSPSPGYTLLSADYSQIELRILAHVSGEPVLMDAFARGEDIHRATAAQVLGKPPAELTSEERNRAKAVNFGIIYGISAFGLSEQLGISRDEAQSFIDTYLARFPEVNEFMKRVIAQAKEDGYVTTLFGRRRPVPELRASNWQTRSLGERLAVNTVMQGSAADIIKVAMIGVHRRLRDEGRRSRLVLQIHDELLFEVADRELSAVKTIVREEMCGAYPLDPALDIDIGTGSSWLDAK